MRIGARGCLVLVALFAVVGCQAGSGAPEAARTTPAASVAPTRAVSSAPGAVPASTVPLRDGGSVSVDAKGKVTLYGKDGSLAGESQCTGNGYDYNSAVSLLNRFQSAVRRLDVAAVVALVDFPMHLSGKEIIDEAALRDQFEKVFTVSAVKAIDAPDPRGLSCGSDGFMMGDGVVWGLVDAAGRYRVQALNV